MSEPQTPPPQKPAETQLLENRFSKLFFSFMAFVAPVPMAIVITDFWLRFQGEVPANQINALYFIKQGMSGGGFGTVWPLLLAVVPSALILAIMFRDVKARVIMSALLLTAALIEFIILSQMSAA